MVWLPGISNEFVNVRIVFAPRLILEVPVCESDSIVESDEIFNSPSVKTDGVFLDLIVVKYDFLG